MTKDEKREFIEAIAYCMWERRRYKNEDIEYEPSEWWRPEATAYFAAIEPLIEKMIVAAYSAGWDHDERNAP